MDDNSTNVNKQKKTLSRDGQHFYKYQPNRDI